MSEGIDFISGAPALVARRSSWNRDSAAQRSIGGMSSRPWLNSRKYVPTTGPGWATAMEVPTRGRASKLSVTSLPSSMPVRYVARGARWGAGRWLERAVVRQRLRGTGFRTGSGRRQTRALRSTIGSCRNIRESTLGGVDSTHQSPSRSIGHCPRGRIHARAIIRLLGPARPAFRASHGVSLQRVCRGGQ